MRHPVLLFVLGQNRCNVGYCFINFLEPRYIPPFVQNFEGQRWKSFNSEKVPSPI